MRSTYITMILAIILFVLAIIGIVYQVLGALHIQDIRSSHEASNYGDIPPHLNGLMLDYGVARLAFFAIALLSFATALFLAFRIWRTKRQPSVHASPSADDQASTTAAPAESTR